jgi:hypothetical protein
MAGTTHPVRLEGRLEDDLSRWLWLVKWLLAIPHFVILAFLWLAALVVGVIAFFAILFTARYPRSLFDFTLGVMRWTWRVVFYSYGALGTDRYPPFTLGPAPDYPATLDIAYPEQLSRGLVLVKWWLLAIPHYLVVAIFAGGWTLPFSDGTWWAGGTGLVTLLAVIAMVSTLVGRSYPLALFDFIMGLNRWCYRVLAYAALLRDEYPPFRLDSGGPDPASASSASE